ncbi:MAG: GNAT family N-acetyltransferase [Sphingomonadaceae bacterium]
MFIRSENLLLRPSWTDDLDEFVALINDERVAKKIGTKALPDSAEMAREIISRPREHLLPHFFINLRTEDGLKLIGSIGLGRAEDGIEMGYWLGAQYWGQGYASEAAQAVLEHAWMLGHTRIIAIHFTGNEATERVLEKCGFEATGETRMRFNVREGRDAPAAVYVAHRPEKAKDSGFRVAVASPQPA